MTQHDRYEPLPSLVELPAWIRARTSPAARIAALALVAVLIAAAVVIAPRIAETKRDNAASERRGDERTRRDIRARVVERQHPHTTSPGPRDPGVAAPRSTRIARRAALARAVPAAVRRDSDARRGATPVRRVDCQRAARSLRAARAGFACTAVTSDVANAGSSGRGVIGYPYRVALDYRRGTVTLCQVAGQAGEGTFVRDARVPLSPGCG